MHPAFSLSKFFVKRGDCLAFSARVIVYNNSADTYYTHTHMLDTAKTAKE